MHAFSHFDTYFCVFTSTINRRLIFSHFHEMLSNPREIHHSIQTHTHTHKYARVKRIFLLFSTLQAHSTWRNNLYDIIVVAKRIIWPFDAVTKTKTKNDNNNNDLFGGATVQTFVFFTCLLIIQKTPSTVSPVYACIWWNAFLWSSFGPDWINGNHLLEFHGNSFDH